MSLTSASLPTQNCVARYSPAGNPGGRHTPDKVLPSVLGYQRSSWAGNPSNVYDTTRAASLGSSSGSGVSVSANLVMASLGEETRASCRGPSNHNACALILPHKAMLGFDGGAIGADIYCDRTGILARKLEERRSLNPLCMPVPPPGLAGSKTSEVRRERRPLRRLSGREHLGALDPGAFADRAQRTVQRRIARDHDDVAVAVRRLGSEDRQQVMTLDEALAMLKAEATPPDLRR